MHFGLCNVPATFQRLMQNCLGKLNFMYCLIYLDNMIVFSKPEEECLWYLHVMFKCFWEHNLKLKLSTCKFFHSEINYLAHHVSKEGTQASKENLKVMGEFILPRTYIKIWAFLGLVGHYWWFIKGFSHVAQPLHEHLFREGAGKRNEWVMLTSNVKVAFETLKKACLEAPVLPFADFDKTFLLETDTRKLELGAVLLQKQSDRWYHHVAYASWSLTIHEHNYHSTKQEFPALKWVIVEQFQEYLCWKPFVVNTDYNPLTYTLTAPNLDATWHHWVDLLAGFTFSIEYQKGIDNTVADVLHCVASKLNADAVRSILDGVTVGTAGRANAHDPMMAEVDARIHQQVEETAVQGYAIHMHAHLHVMDWAAVQQEEPILKLWWSGFPPIKCQIPDIFWETSSQQKRAWPSWGRGRNSAPSGYPLSLPYSSWGAWGSSVVSSPHST